MLWCFNVLLLVALLSHSYSYNNKLPSSTINTRNSINQQARTFLMFRKSKEKNFDDEKVINSVMNSNMSIKYSPGYTSSLPITTAESSKKELARTVIAFAVLWLTIQVNYEKFANKYLPKTNRTDGLLNEFSQYKALTDGVMIEEISTGDSLPTDTDSLMIVYKLFYNGFEVKNYMNNYGTTMTLPRDTEERKILFENMQLSGLLTGIQDMKINSRRRVFLDNSKAFGITGYEPGIPPNAINNVLVDVTLKKLN